MFAKHMLKSCSRCCLTEYGSTKARRQCSAGVRTADVPKDWQLMSDTSSTKEMKLVHGIIILVDAQLLDRHESGC